MKITTILPVSRTAYLERVLNSLVNQTRKTDNLLLVFDGNEHQYVEIRNKVAELKIPNVLCVLSMNEREARVMPERREHIVNIHNQAGNLIDEADWVFSIEDDGELPLNALEKLVNQVKTLEDVGMVTGVELGRWGVPYVGAWRVDDINEPKVVTSLENHAGEDKVEELDGCGLYCALIRADKYKEHTFFTANGLGPDVNLGLFLRQQGLKNYIDWSIPVTHITLRDGEHIDIPATSESRVLTLTLLYGTTWKY